jgi:hypothetical protein
LDGVRTARTEERHGCETMQRSFEEAAQQAEERESAAAGRLAEMEGYVADLRTYLNESKARETVLHERLKALRMGDRSIILVASPNPDPDPTSPLEEAHSLEELRQVTAAAGLGTSVLQDEGATAVPGTETRASKAKTKPTKTPKAATKPKPTAKATKAAAAKAAAAKGKGPPSSAQPKEGGEDPPGIRTRQSGFWESVKMGVCNSAETEGDKRELVEPEVGEASALWHGIVPVGTIRDSTGALFQIGGPPTDGSQNPGDGGGNRSQEQAEEMDDPVDWGDEESCEKKVLSEEEGDDEGEDPEV